jgi:hypothetical protein
MKALATGVGNPHLRRRLCAQGPAVMWLDAGAVQTALDGAGFLLSTIGMCRNEFV